ncbi:dicer-like protein 4 isoform X3 [Capsella rubella]|uniref:dicer-like protein 4 isoform X3 n=1 Tax=Capsella rubella TaxID=81985 RepID=UPI000CD4F454|nr:dicer-like protein 4 isoform X3 [Capsella rubella]
MSEAVDLSLTTTPSKLLGKRDREQKKGQIKNKNKKAKKQRGNYFAEEANQKHPILTATAAAATHNFLPALTMPYGEIAGDFGSPDCDADASSDIHLSSSSSFSSFSSSSSSLFSAPGACTDDPSAKMEKDPRKIARRYQLELCKKAMDENIIVYLGTGCGKTHIAVMLIYELGHLVLRPKKSVCIFLAPTVALVEQQAKVISDTINFKVAVHCGGKRIVKSHSDWEREISENEVLVMTPQILLHNLQHCFIRMESISLLIFDECHHAQQQSNHPYAEIMKVFYKSESLLQPRIFGMTASPVVGKGSFQSENLSKSINSLENLLNAKVYSVESNVQLDGFVSSPLVKVYYYRSAMSDASQSTIRYENLLEDIKQRCLASLKLQIDTHQTKSLLNMKRLLKRTHDNLIYTLMNLGLWGAIQAAKIQLNSDHNEQEDHVGEKHKLKICDTYLSLAAEVLSSGVAEDENASEVLSLAALKEPLFSRKLVQLIEILSVFRLEPHMKCIIFVNRIVTARTLSCILNKLELLRSWKSDFLVGISSGLKSMSRKSMETILKRFQSKELNLLVATKVGEEGLDIQTCCLVIRYDLPETVTSFIQSRGRARMPQSEYAFLVDSGNEKEMDLIENFKVNENRMNLEITSRTSEEICPILDEELYRVHETGACISGGSSISLLYKYCSRLPHDEFFQPKPEFQFKPGDEFGGTICRIILPANAPISEVFSSLLPSTEAAKKDACLKAVYELHNLGVLNDFLLPDSKDEIEDEFSDDDFDFNNVEGCSRGELYEMLVPGLFKQKWDPSTSCVNLHSYYIRFVPHPADRIYRKFGFFMKSPLPVEAETMGFDLHLAHQRSVSVKIFPAGVTTFDNDEIRLAELFQEVALKVLFERQELIPEFVPLELQYSSRTCKSTFYLLLPISLQDAESHISVDWVTINRCLSSPIFKTPSVLVENIVPPTGSHLKLANGCWNIDDVKNSLVFTTHNKQFYFVADICHGRNGFSPVKESSTRSHVESTYKLYGVELKHPLQPLLRVKPVCHVRNLLHNRMQKNLGTEPQELAEYFIEIPAELSQLKIKGFSKDLGSSLSLLPSIMHRIENLLVAIELKHVLSASIPEIAEVSGHRVLEALTTEKCHERLSLERLEVLGDAFLKFAVSRHLFLHHDRFDEGELTRRRSNIVNNSNLCRLAIKRNLQVYIRDQAFDPTQFFAFGHPCRVTCDEVMVKEVHSLNKGPGLSESNTGEIRCSKGHHFLYKKTIADVVEALVGAFLVDSGFKGAVKFLRWIGINVDFVSSQVQDACVASRRYMPLTTRNNLEALENQLNYTFLHKGLLVQAFIHPSYNKHGGGCYQRLEFLGDAVLDYLMTSYFFTVFPTLKPGQLTDLRSLSVNNKALANVAVNFSLKRFLFCESIYLHEAINDYTNFLAASTSASGPSEGPRCPKVLGDLVESCLGAFFLDCGFNLNRVWTMVLSSFLDPVKNLSNLQISPVKELIELCQFYKWDREILVTKKVGAFSVELKMTKKGCCLTASATGRNKRDSTIKAAQLMITYLKAHEHITTSNPLEDVLKNSIRNEAKLIGYNEEPINVVDLDGLDVENLKLQEIFGENSEISSSYIIRRGIPQEPSKTENRLPQQTIREAGGPITKTAKSLLLETCAANCWKPPKFECCEEEGPGHLKSFAYKVILEVEDAPNMTLECYGDARPTKKGAAEHAAQAAIWCLKHSGFLC